MLFSETITSKGFKVKFYGTRVTKSLGHEKTLSVTISRGFGGKAILYALNSLNTLPNLRASLMHLQWYVGHLDIDRCKCYSAKGYVVSVEKILNKKLGKYLCF